MQFYCFNLDKTSNNFVTRKLFIRKKCIKIFIYDKYSDQKTYLININYKDAIFMHKLFFYRNDLVVFSLFFPFLGYCIPS